VVVSAVAGVHRHRQAGRRPPGGRGLGPDGLRLGKQEACR
jgi:hypothetical protein